VIAPLPVPCAKAIVAGVSKKVKNCGAMLSTVDFSKYFAYNIREFA
jgi:hypothetical protein